ncbi:DNA primase TraC [Caulifigura coniformis]|uniref:DNA primase TraC n=1 Tax=Caulifigura coniformis TaxID=2527983 RepID=A0A517SA55_9PLAN|nr:zincin-like metallopeptidase domain-containing protein [Caulifigura coniformis]QDT53007.1 DNA primase TraC [Caulifigura coniformis]
MKATTLREDVYTRITNQIVEQLQQGVRPWFQPWQVKHAAGSVTRPLRHNGERYQGVNVLSLWMSSELNGYTSPFWLTFQQARELKAHVKKGERGSPVVYASTFKKKGTDEAGDEVETDQPFLKQYTVFNADQIEGLPVHFTATVPFATRTHERIEHAESFFRGTGADIRHGGNRAFYAIEEDYIRLPHFATFRDAESHAATLAHELIHWTRHPSRLDRNLGRKRWGDAGYAAEELVAELGSAFLCADLGITPEVRDDHASYLECWLKVLKDDKRAIFTAASLATKAVEFLHGLQQPPTL